MNIDFYDKYFKYPRFTDVNSAQDFKDNYIHTKSDNGYIYKFIALTDNDELNNSKIELLKLDKFWASYYENFTDDTEVVINYNLPLISKKTKNNYDSIKNFIYTTYEMNDITCFTYSITDYMWIHYANNFNGYCLKFKLFDTDKFFPVIYLNKRSVDFTNDLIKAFRNNDMDSILRLAILPWVLKDYEYQNENELRFLYGGAYDSLEGDFKGKIAPNKKKLMKYLGTSIDYKYAGIELDDIIIGRNCTDYYKKELSLIRTNKINV